MDYKELLNFYNKELVEWNLIYKKFPTLKLLFILKISVIGSLFIAYTILNYSNFEITLSIGIVLGAIAIISCRKTTLRILKSKNKSLLVENKKSLTLNINQIRTKRIKEFLGAQNDLMNEIEKEQLIQFLYQKYKQKRMLYIHTWTTVFGLLAIVITHILISNSLEKDIIQELIFLKIIITTFVFALLLIFNLRLYTGKLFKRRNKYRDLIKILNSIYTN